MIDFDGHGWAVIPFLGSDHPGFQRASLHIGQLPRRKQVCLYGHNGNPSILTVYAYFPTKEKAAEALAIMDRLMKR